MNLLSNHDISKKPSTSKENSNSYLHSVNDLRVALGQARPFFFSIIKIKYKKKLIKTITVLTSAKRDRLLLLFLT